MSEDQFKKNTVVNSGNSRGEFCLSKACATITERDVRGSPRKIEERTGKKKAAGLKEKNKKGGRVRLPTKKSGQRGKSEKLRSQSCAFPKTQKVPVNL